MNRQQALGCIGKMVFVELKGKRYEGAVLLNEPDKGGNIRVRLAYSGEERDTNISKLHKKAPKQ